MIVTITAIPARAVAWMSISRKRSSRPSPRSPRTVSLRPPSSTSAPNPLRIASENRPAPGSPPIHCAARKATPSATANSGRNHLDLVICISIEHRLHRRLEEPGEREGERERRQVALLLDRVDRLPRHPDGRGELALRELSPRPQLAHTVLHGSPVK